MESKSRQEAVKREFHVTYLGVETKIYRTLAQSVACMVSELQYRK